MQRFVKAITWLLVAALIFAAPVVTAFGAEAPQVVRVGFYDFPGLQQLDAEGNGRGYNYDYLQEIAKHTGWTYEYVGVTLAQGLELLEKGQLDLIGGMQYLPERTQKFEYPTYSSGVASVGIFVLDTDTRYAYGDTESFEGMTVGVLDQLAANGDLLDYCKKKNFSIHTVSYDTEEELSAALHSGKVDAISSISFHDKAGIKSIADFAYKDFYFISTKGNTALIRQLDDALEEIKTQNPYFEMELGRSYFVQNTSLTPVFTKEEQEYLQSIGTLNAVYNANWAPLERYNESTRDFEGVTAKMFDYITEKTGLQFCFLPQKDAADTYEKVQNKDVQIICSVESDYNWASRHKIKITSPYLDVPVVMVTQAEPQQSQWWWPCRTTCSSPSG